MAHWKKRETVFAEGEIKVILPGAWQLRPATGAHRWLYRSADHREHLTFSRGDADGAYDVSEQEAIVRRSVVRQRRAVELGFGRVPNLTMSPPEFFEHNGVPASRYYGSAGLKHQFRALLVCTPDAVWTLFYEGFGVSEVDAEARAESIFNSISFP